MASANGQRTAALESARIQMLNQGQTDQYLSDLTDKGLGALGTGVTNAKADLGAYLPASLGVLSNAFDSGQGALHRGYDAALTDVSQGISGLNPYVAAGNSATGMYTDALGLNGPEGNQRAVGAFQASPGYQWQTDQALEGALRKYAAAGGSQSGNLIDATARLGTLGQQGQAAATSQLGGFENMGQLDAGRGKDLASLVTNIGSAQSNLYSNYGSALAGLDAGQGQATLGAFQGLGNTIANINTNAANQMSRGFLDAGQATDAARNANSSLPLQLLAFGLKAGTANLGGGTTALGALGKGLFG